VNAQKLSAGTLRGGQKCVAIKLKIFTTLEVGLGIASPPAWVRTTHAIILTNVGLPQMACGARETNARIEKAMDKHVVRRPRAPVNAQKISAGTLRGFHSNVANTLKIFGTVQMQVGLGIASRPA
jgi:heme O synthase-like polyprenyltransferase